MQEAVNFEWECFFKARRGDEVAWRVLVGQHQTRLAALALFVTGSPAAAEDVVQETFVRALRARIRHTKGTVQGFLGTIAYRLALKEAKRARRCVELEGLEPSDGSQDALERVLENERDRLVAEAIGALDARQRDVLTLRFYGGYSYEEIAKILDIPLGTVKSRVFHAVKSCRNTLRERGVLK
ncbi:MAG: RNA polymerase sigma factor [Candidatus Eiseniibacteriota bacterium]|nr:MAG: RNA polymerase sigma factor [Candidatus Eisenbacteria bacterium]